MNDFSILDRRTEPVDLSRPHLTGIGDPDLTALAAFYMSAGLPVTGSEAVSSQTTAELRRRGCTIRAGYSPPHIHGASVVIASPAIPADNSEIIAAHRQGVPVIGPVRALSALTAARIAVAVTGTCGKTGTAGMLVHLLEQVGAEPSWIIGDDLADAGLLSRARRGTGELIVIECDPADAVELRPDVAVLTNLHDGPHREAADGLLRQMAADGLVIASGDDPGVRTVLEHITSDRAVKAPDVVTYGRCRDATWTFVHGVHGPGYRVRAHGPRSAVLESVVPGIGLHQTCNAVAAVLTAVSLGLSPRDLAEALATFKGVQGYLTIVGVVHGVTVLASAARHPEALRADLSAARDLTDARGKVHLLHAPASADLTSQTWHLLLTGADRVTLLLSPASPDRPSQDEAVPGAALTGVHADRLGIERARGPEEVIEMSARHARPGDVVVVMGPAHRTGHLAASLLQRLCGQGR